MVYIKEYISKLEWGHTGRPKKRDNLIEGEGGGGEGEGAKSYDGDKVWSSIIH
jgi:hypothetical protein